MKNSSDSLFVVVVVVVVLLTSVASPDYFTTASSAELGALMAMRSSLDPTGKILKSWKQGGKQCGGRFVGVACNAQGKVSNISLQGKELSGKLPAAVAELKSLSGLYLHYNSLRGGIPNAIAKLTELTDLYLNFNNLTGSIPPEIGRMSSLQVVQLGYNQLTGPIPDDIGSLKNLNSLALESNKLSGQIPDSLGKLRLLKRLYLNSNKLSGTIPAGLANDISLQALHLQNNSLVGIVPLGLKRMSQGFLFQNNPGLCGTGFSTLRACTPFDNLNININHSTNMPRSAAFPLACNHSVNCSKSPSKLPQIGIVGGATVLTIALTVSVFVGVVRYRRQKQKVGDKKSDISRDDGLSMSMNKSMSMRTDQHKGSYKRSPSVGWEPTNVTQDLDLVVSNKFNMEEVESATQHFSEVNLLGKSKFSAVYKGIMKDGSTAAIKSINRTSRKSEEDEFLKGLRLLNSLKHENLVELKGYCCSKARGGCYLVYDFAPRGILSRYLNADGDALEWPTRVSIIRGIAKGIQYLHSNQPNKPPIVHQNISVEKVLLDQQFKPLISDVGLLKLLADDVVYSALKVSAALGYMAPEYITTGRFTEKSDLYAYGVIIFQLLCGKTKMPGTTRVAAESGNFEEFMDSKLEGKYVETEATRLIKIALDCTGEVPEKRPSIESVVRELNVPKGG